MLKIYDIWKSNEILQTAWAPNYWWTLACNHTSLCIPIARAATGLIRQDRVPKLSIHAHLLDFLRGEYFDASDTVDKLPVTEQM